VPSRCFVDSTCVGMFDDTISMHHLVCRCVFVSNVQCCSLVHV